MPAGSQILLLYGNRKRPFRGLFSPTGCCDCQTCVVCEDSFNRFDTDPVVGSACEWSQEAGVWQILFQTLKTSSDNALLLAAAVPTETNYRVECIISGSTGDVVKVIVDYEDTDNYHYAQLTLGAGGSLKLFRREAGVNTELDSSPMTLTTVGEFRLCTLAASLSAKAANGGTQIYASAARTFANAGQVALATGNIGTVTFDSVAIEHLSDDCGPCEACSFCVIDDEDTTPTQYRIRVPAGSVGTNGLFACGDCGDLVGEYVVDQVEACTYELEFTPVCGYYKIQLVIQNSGYVVWFRNTTPAYDFSAQATQTGQKNCRLSNRTLVGGFNSGTPCSFFGMFGASNIFVTAL